MSRIYFTDRDLGNQFPDILIAAGLRAERHGKHFSHDCPDEVWLEEVAAHGWIAVTHNSRIRYTPNELDVVMKHGVALLVVIGKAPQPLLARSFASTQARIEAFLDLHTPPYIAKVYRPSLAELDRDPRAPGRIELWHPR